jgi:toxin secretion/phage lysis holin
MAYRELYVIIIALMVFDIVTGIAAAIKDKKYSSKEATSGLVKKLAVFLLLVMVSDICSMKPFVVSIDFLLWIFASTELVSVLQNMTRIFGQDAFFGVLNTFLTKIIRMKQDESMKKMETTVTSGSTKTTETKSKQGTTTTTETSKKSKTTKKTPKKNSKNTPEPAKKTGRKKTPKTQ